MSEHACTAVQVAAGQEEEGAVVAGGVIQYNQQGSQEANLKTYLITVRQEEGTTSRNY
jgi:hypothetical protein